MNCDAYPDLCQVHKSRSVIDLFLHPRDLYRETRRRFFVFAAENSTHALSLLH
jgi:hypothetical protein